MPEKIGEGVQDCSSKNMSKLFGLKIRVFKILTSWPYLEF